MQFNSDFIPGREAFVFMEGRILPLKIVSVEFVDPVAYGQPSDGPYGLCIRVVMPDGNVQPYIENQGLFPNVEGVLETLLPEGFRGKKVTLSGEPLPVQTPAQAPVQSSAPQDPPKGTARRKVADPAPAPESAPTAQPPLGPIFPEGGGDGNEAF